jgi:hypothetical protein
MMRILGGDWREGRRAGFRIGVFGKPKWLLMPGKFPYERINFDQIAGIEQVTAENKTSLGGAVGWGTAGAALAGPVGLLAGALLGGKRQRNIVAVRFNDGRSVLLECPPKDFRWLLGVAYQRKPAASAKAP